MPLGENPNFQKKANKTKHPKDKKQNNKSPMNKFVRHAIKRRSKLKK